MQINVIDKGAGFYVNLGAYALPHAFREGLVFHPGIKYQVEEDSWISGQPTMSKTTLDEDTTDAQLVAKTPGSPQFDREADEEAARRAAADYAAKEPERKQAEAERAAREAEELAAKQEQDKLAAAQAKIEKADEAKAKK